jgi:uncharacterized membrane protein (DUF106 family)
MLDLWNTLSLAVGDFLLGWLLFLPRDLTLLIVVLFTALVLIALRQLTAPQDRLARAAADSRRLKQLLREARHDGDKAAMTRYRGTKSLIAMVKLKAEAWPLVASLVPIAIVATWALFRLEYLPVRPGQRVELVLYTPVTAAGEVAHVVPEEGLNAEGGWVRRIGAVTDDGPPHGLAAWDFEAVQERVYHLVVRFKDKSLNRELIVGPRFYALPVVDHGDDILSEWKRQPWRWLGVVPGIEALGLPAWLIGYVVMVVPITLLLKRALGVY